MDGGGGGMDFEGGGGGMESDGGGGGAVSDGGGGGTPFLCVPFIFVCCMKFVGGEFTQSYSSRLKADNTALNTA